MRQNSNKSPTFYHGTERNQFGIGWANIGKFFSGEKLLTCFITLLLLSFSTFTLGFICQCRPCTASKKVAYTVWHSLVKIVFATLKQEVCTMTMFKTMVFSDALRKPSARLKKAIEPQCEIR